MNNVDVVCNTLTDLMMKYDITIEQMVESLQKLYTAEGCAWISKAIVSDIK